MNRRALLAAWVALETLACTGSAGRGPGTTPRETPRPGRRASAPVTAASADLAQGREALARPKPDFPAALLSFERALKREPTQREARINAAFCLLRLGRLIEAEALYRTAAARPSDREALFGWVDVLLRLDRHEPAVRALSGWIEAHPTDLEALALASEVHRRAGAPELALERVQQALTLDRKNPEAHLMFARLYLDRKDARTALMIIGRGLQHHRRHPGLLLSRGLAWQALGEMGRAVMDFESAIQADGSLVAGRLLLGKVYVDNLDFEGARKHFEAVLSAWPNHLEAGLGYARALFGKKLFKEALAGYQAILKQHGEEPRALFQIAKIYQDHLESPPLALDHYRRFVKAQPTLPKDDPVFATLKMLESMSQAPRRPPSVPRPAAPSPRPGGERP